MNEATRTAYEKMTAFLSLWPALDIIVLNTDKPAPFRVQKVYNIMPIIDGKKRFRYRLVGNRDDKILSLEPDRAYHYPCIAPGQALNDDRARERFVERIAWTWNISLEDFYTWFAFAAPEY